MRSAEPRRHKRRLTQKTTYTLPRIGFGYDIHRLVEGRSLVLGGVLVPAEKGLLGHSDADVLLHAICDALLGASALGDIGKHFPDTEERFKGISSLTLLSHVCELIAKEGFVIGNIDSTVVLERPKIARFVPEMKKLISGSADIREDQISIKATTNEGLGALGRGEGCSAMAVALLVPTHNKKAHSQKKSRRA